MWGYERLTPEERKEFLGTSRASLLASLGTVLGAAGLVLLPLSPVFIFLSVLGALCLVAALVTNLRKEFTVKWRRVNVVIHAILLFGLVAAAAAVWLRR